MNTTYIDKYFMDFHNAHEPISVSWWRKVSAEEFYSLGETEQENAFVLMKRIICDDWFSMSVQANYWAYCWPIRTTIRNKYMSFYDTYEVGYPSESEDLLLEYAENSDNPTETVYPYVPKEVIEAVITKHNIKK